MKKTTYLWFVFIGMLLIGLFSCPNFDKPPMDPTTTPTIVPNPTAPPTAVPTTVPTAGPTTVPSTEPTLPPSPGKPGTVWMDMETSTVNSGSQVAIKLMVNTGNQKFAAYGIDVLYNSTILAVNTGIGTSGVVVAPNGFVSAVNPNEPGILVISGFDTAGKDASTSLHFITLNFNAINTGTSNIDLSVNTLVNEIYAPIGTPAGMSSSITVE